MEAIDQKSDSIRRYLLGQVSGEEGQQLEERFMTDHEYREEVLIIEEDLIEEYFSDRLSTEEKEAFETCWAPYHAERLEMARALNRYCEEQPPRVASQVLRTERFNRKHLIIGALAAGFLFLILSVAWLVFKQQQDRRGHYGEEIARLNAQSTGSEAPAGAVIVSPVALRSADVPKITTADRGPVVTLLLVLPPDQHTSYQVILRCTNPPEDYTVENLQAISTNSGRAIVFKIPSALLTRGDYSLEVRGRTSPATFESVADYNLQVFD
jgi:hypothetical protein